MEEGNQSTIYGDYDILDSIEEDGWRRHTTYESPLIRLRDHNLIITPRFLDYAEKIHDFKAKEDDVWIMSYPKSGTTWMGELVWCLRHGLDFEKATSVVQEKRIPFLEMCCLPKDPKMFSDSIALAEKEESPRTLKSHLPFSMLPPDVIESKSKIVYIYRNPRDVCVSLYNHFNLWHEHTATFEEHVDFFLKDTCGYYSPFFANIKSFVENKECENILLVSYEEMKCDLSGVIDKVGKFLGTPELNADSKEALMHYLDFKSMKANPSVNKKNYAKKDGFINKGIVGNWRHHLSSDMIQRFEEWEKNNMKDFDLSFTFELK